MSTRSKKSHVPYVADGKHPFTPVAALVTSNMDELRAIKKRVLAMRKKITPTLFDTVALKKAMEKNGDRDRLRRIVRQMLTDEPKVYRSEHSLPKPPPATELYTRIAKESSILDVGSGKGVRLIQFQGQFEMETVDKVEAKTRLDCKHTHGEFLKPVEKVITSFNSLTNNKSILPFVGSDGVHIVPDVEAFVEVGYGEKKKGDVVETVAGVNKVFIDYIHPLKTAQITPFYCGFNTYRARSMSFMEKELFGENGPQLLSTGKRVTVLSPVPEDKLTYKYRGELKKLTVRNVRGHMIGLTLDRGGIMRRTKSSGDVEQMSLLYEETVGGSLRLIKVESFRCFRPFHSLECLEYFLSRVKIKVNGKDLQPPERFKGGPWPFNDEHEGVVWRDRGEDFLLRARQGIDIESWQLESLLLAIQDEGVDVVHCDKVEGEGVHELEVIDEGGGKIKLVNLGLKKKKKGESVRDAVKKLAWPTVLSWQNVKRGSRVPTFTHHVEDIDGEPDSDDERSLPESWKTRTSE